MDRGTLLILLTLVPLVVADDSDQIECRHVYEVEDKCAFTKSDNSTCGIDEGFINYIQIVFCSFSSAVPLGLIIFVLWWLFLFVGLAVTADDFFCPSLTVIAKVLHMSDNIAGVTLLAFGNGAPDIFSAIAAVGSIKNGDAGLAFGALLGAGVFVTAVVSGAVIISKPFQCMERPLLRDIVFYIAALFYAFYIMYQRMITTAQAVGFLLLYLVYVITVILGRYIRKKFQSPSEPAPGEESAPATPVGEDPDLPTTFSKHLADEICYDNGVTPRHHHHTHQVQGNRLMLDNSSQVYRSVEEMPLLSSVQVEPRGTTITEFLDAINPVCKEEWLSSRWFGKIYLVVKAPIQLLLTITCPVVDYDSENDNWNRHLTALQLLLGPMFAVFATDQYKVMLGGVFPLWALFLIVFLVLAVLGFWFSQNKTPPVWHPAMAFLGFVVAVVWIYCIANEIVNLLQLFGVAFGISDAILGLTFLAWGNSIGDLIADVSLARKGYPRIGISACFGGPLFNLLLGVGIPFTIGCVKNDNVFKLNFDFLQIVLAGGLVLSLLSTLIIASLFLKFFLKRWFGIYLIALYCIFLTVALLTETKVINVDVSNW